MSRQCMVTGKKVMMGNNVSHAHNKTRKAFMPNLQDTSVFSEALSRKIKIRVSMAGLRTIDHNGGFDQWVAKTPKSKLDPKLRAVKAAVEKKLAEMAKVAAK